MIGRNCMGGWIAFWLLAFVFPSCAQQSKNVAHQEVSLTHQEKHRPQYHFTPKAMWMNDPNGMVYYQGEYHLFYQHYPDSTVWGPMHWGHAISKDLVHWEYFPIALYPDSLGYIFSGSVVVDWDNTTGFGSADSPPLVAIFTHRHLDGKERGFESQSLAYSIDKGRSWVKYKGNPVLVDENSLGFRDPKVFWHEETKKWVMVISAEDQVKLYSSVDLIDWALESEFGRNLGAHGGVWECPDLFELVVEGSDETKWVMLVSIGSGGPNGGSATQYFVGDFDGTSFIPVESGINWLDYGKDNYAGVTWYNHPDNLRVYVGWMSNWQYANVVPTHPWRSAMTIPRQLRLQYSNNQYKLVSAPIAELKNLRGDSRKLPSRIVATGQDVLVEDQGLGQAEYIFEFDGRDQGVLTADSLVIEWSNRLGEKLELGYSIVNNQFYISRNHAGAVDFSEEFPVVQRAPLYHRGDLKVRVFMDWSSIEVFVNDGALAMTSLVFPNEPFDRLRIFAVRGQVEMKSAEIWNLKTIWSNKAWD